MALDGVETGNNKAQEQEMAMMTGAAMPNNPVSDKPKGTNIEDAAVLLITLLNIIAR